MGIFPRVARGCSGCWELLVVARSCSELLVVAGRCTMYTVHGLLGFVQNYSEIGESCSDY